jgi:ORF6N domain
MRNKTADIRILTVRDQKVVLDTDLAAVYGVTTKRLNEQFRRNRRRFPEGFAFQLSAREYESLRSQVATSSSTMRSQIATASGGEPSNWSQIATSSRKHRGKVYRPWAFTEHGALQAANILRSDRAIAMSVYVIRAFIELREKVAANAAILKVWQKSTGRCWNTTLPCATFTRSCFRSSRLRQSLHAGKSDFRIRNDWPRQFVNRTA